MRIKLSHIYAVAIIIWLIGVSHHIIFYDNIPVKLENTMANYGMILLAFLITGYVIYSAYLICRKYR